FRAGPAAGVRGGARRRPRPGPETARVREGRTVGREDGQVGVSIVVMAHPKRKEWAEDLADQLDCPIIWDEKNVMWDTGRRALLAGLDMGGTHHLVIQDDCILSDGLLEVLPELTRPGPVSLYAGRNGNGRKAMTMARNARTQWFRYIGLVWGPAV